MNGQPKRAERDISDIPTIFMSDNDYRLYINELVKLEKAKKAGGEQHGC